MIQIRKADTRGHAEHGGWLDSWHTFSFADYYDPEHMGYSVLRVINDDTIAPGAGFPTHAHQDMEIVTYVLEGALEHRDSLGNGDIIRPGDVQRMSAGTGIRHSEFNPSQTEPVRLLQIWLLPQQPGVAPGYEQTRFDPAQLQGRFRVVASPDGREGSVRINQDTLLYAAKLDQGETARMTLAPGRRAYLQVAQGDIELKGFPLHQGDGAEISQEAEIIVSGLNSAEILVFDLQ
jgi:redox-sensitive bicupin YhaK (pirin superfamily)